MKRVKLVSLGLVAMFVVGAMASASASAVTLKYATCTNVGSGGHWKDSACTKAEANGAWDTVAVTSATAIEGTSGISKLKTEISSTKVVVICEKDTFVGKIEAEGKSKATITYEKCSLENETTKEKLGNCKVPNIEAKVKDQLIANGAVIEDEFTEEGAGPFANVVIEGSLCTLKGTYPVTGSQICKLPDGQKPAVEHPIECTAAGSKLKFNGSAAATYEGTSRVHIVLIGIVLVLWLSS